MSKRIYKVISAVLVVALLLLALSLIGPYLFGCKTFAVLSGSMEPQFPVGSLVTVQMGVVPNEIQAGDSITFYLGTGEIGTHRVVENNAEERYFITKGDANEQEDLSPVPYGSLIGRVAYSLPLLGFLVVKLHSREGVFLIAGVLIAVILTTFLPAVLKADSKEVEKKEEP